MKCNFNFVADRVIQGKMYPALAQWSAEPYTENWRKFDQHWPYTVPLRLQEYCDWNQCSITLHDINAIDGQAFYPIALGWFDFSIDYFELLSDQVKQKIKENKIQILFYYHEGDNPHQIKQRLDLCAKKNKLPHNCYKFVSGNSAALGIKNFVHFVDFELWYWHRNRNYASLKFNDQPRRRTFSILNRLSRDWRMAAMADLWGNGLLTNSYWSYCEAGNFSADTCPIAVDSIENLSHYIKQFQQQLPVFCDELSQEDRNDVTIVVPDFYNDAYFQVVFETHFDADGTRGTFLTEKTFKPIKHCQPFIIAGPSGSLQLLRNMGYKTFDHVLDNRYDTVTDNTQRWIVLKTMIANLKTKNLYDLCQACKSDCEHNQNLFVSLKQNRLSKLIKDLHEKS